MSAKNSPILQTYLYFNGRCEEAIEFYKRAVGAEVEMLMRFKDNPEPPPADQCPPGTENKVMHASLKIGGTVLMASDGRCTGKMNFDGFGLTLAVASEAEADKYFNALADGGKIQMPLERTFFSPRFGMTMDRFGVCWLIMVRPN